LLVELNHSHLALRWSTVKEVHRVQPEFASFAPFSELTMCTRSQLENAERKADDEVVSLGADSGAQCARVHSFRRWTQSKKVKLPGSRRKQSVLTGLCISGRWRAEPFASGTVCKEDMARSYFERKRNTFDEAQCEILSVQSRAAGTQVDTELAVAQFGNTCLCRCASRAELDPSLRWDDGQDWLPAFQARSRRRAGTLH
jgi:hypothetical protein